MRLKKIGINGGYMSYYDYILSRRIQIEEYPFYALIMAAMRQADDVNTEKLKYCWPQVYQELSDRYNAPGGFLPGETRPDRWKGG